MADSVVKVRAGRKDDIPHVLRMIHDLATFEGYPNGPKLTEEELAADGFGPSPWFQLLVAEVNAVIVGYALYNRAYSSWTRRALYLEDLYVSESWRGKSVGWRLMRELCVEAMRLRVERIDWHVLKHNTRAVQFYQHLGARDLDETEGRVPLRLELEYIQLIALTPYSIKEMELKYGCR